MKILLLIQKPQFRGAEIFACQLANHLLANNHRVILVSIFRGNAELPFNGQYYSLDRPANKRLSDFEGWRVLSDIIRREKPDIIQANAGDTLKFAALSKFIFRWKTPLIFRNASKASDFIDSRLKYWFNGFLLKQVNHVISVSELCRIDFAKTYRYFFDDTTMIPIGIEVSSIPNLPCDLTYIFGEGPVLACVGSLVPEKNHIGLFRIFTRIKETMPEVQLVLVGSGRLEDEVIKNIKAFKLEQHVHFLGTRTDVLAIVKSCSALLLPSHIEGLPGVILEAMHCKTPVIAYDVGGISEAVIPGKTGWLIEKGDEIGFADAVISLLSNKGQVEHITDEAYAHVVTYYDNRMIARRFVEAYRNVLQSIQHLVLCK